MHKIIFHHNTYKSYFIVFLGLKILISIYSTVYAINSLFLLILLPACQSEKKATFTFQMLWNQSPLIDHTENISGENQILHISFGAADRAEHR